MCPSQNLLRLIKCPSGDAVIPTNKPSFGRILHYDEEDRVNGTANTRELVISRNSDSAYAPYIRSFANTDEAGVLKCHIFFCDCYFV